MDFFQYAVSGDWIVGGNEFPDFLQVCDRIWMKNKAIYEPRRFFLLLRRVSKAASPSIGLTRPLLISS